MNSDMSTNSNSIANSIDTERIVYSKSSIEYSIGRLHIHIN
jgi:hypothetical protein